MNPYESPRLDDAPPQDAVSWLAIAGCVVLGSIILLALVGAVLSVIL